MSAFDYWHECVSIAFDEAGIEATPAQIRAVADAVEGGHENYGMAHGHDCIPNPIALEADRLAGELKRARAEQSHAEDVWCEAMAHIGGVRPNQLYRDGGRIKVQP